MIDIEQPYSGPGNGVLLNLSGYGHWETGVDFSSDYNFYFNNSLKAYILDTDGSYISTSDRRLKKNIRTMQPLLAKVLELKPKTYMFKDTKPGSSVSYGFIAQDVEKIFPEFVNDKQGIKGLGYSNFGVIAIKAIQEQQIIIEDLQKQINDLKKQLEKERK